MLPPDVIEKIKRDREERERKSPQIPLYVPEIRRPEEEKKKNEENRTPIVIELA